MALIGGVININNSEVSFIKARIDSNLNIVLKKILDKLNMTQQEFIDKKIKEFVIENVHLIVSENDKKIITNENRPFINSCNRRRKKRNST